MCPKNSTNWPSCVSFFTSNSCLVKWKENSLRWYWKFGRAGQSTSIFNCVGYHSSLQHAGAISKAVVCLYKSLIVFCSKQPAMGVWAMSTASNPKWTHQLLLPQGLGDVQHAMGLGGSVWMQIGLLRGCNNVFVFVQTDVWQESTLSWHSFDVIWHLPPHS